MQIVKNCYHSGGLRTTEYASRDSPQRRGISKAICVAMQGRYNERGTVEQHLEPRYDELTNTITTVQKDNLVLINCI